MNVSSVLRPCFIVLRRPLATALFLALLWLFGHRFAVCFSKRDASSGSFGYVRRLVNLARVLIVNKIINYGSLQ